MPKCCFNPRARAGRDNIRVWLPSLDVFQSTRPRGARPLATVASTLDGLFQSTRPRGARRSIVPGMITREVSIHAPARGATRFARKAVFVLRFQSTRPRGARHADGRDDLGDVAVSIHAPARGATVECVGQEHAVLVSIHAPARGATVTAEVAVVVGQFQSTRPRGARHQHGRSPLGWYVSIHAPARGATRPGQGARGHERFQSTRPRGARHRRRVGRVGWIVSIHAPARGATVDRSTKRALQLVSIHAPARGAT